jgi:predicted phosphate transport protein (TIGR00153 family)
MRLALVPKTSEFYDLFRAAGENALQSTRLLEQLIREFPNNSSVTQERVKELERAGDQITHDIIQLLNTQYVTPFDREDIYELATAVDDVVDNEEHTSHQIGLYNNDVPTRHSLEQARILVRAAEQLALLLADLKGRREVQSALLELKRAEDDGDRVQRDAIAALFLDPRIDPLIVIRWKDIYERLEDAIDACEKAANVVGNIAVKNA